MRKSLIIAVTALTLAAAVGVAEILKTRNLEAEIVKIDAAAKAITFKEAGAEKTAPCGGLCPSQLKTVKAGDKVTLTCVDDGDGKSCREIRLIKKPLPSRK